jgi:glycerol-3-phosphate dehydrogenase
MGGERLDQNAALERLGSEQFDVLVIGGGITGAGVAVDAAARGLRTALVEAEDFASGTSSASSKLVHGGLRYLQQYEVGLVFQSLAERQTLLRNAPHLVQPIVFVLPVFGDAGIAGQAMAWTYSAGLWLYDLLGGLHIHHLHRRASAEEVRSHLPTLRTDHLLGGFIYYDARTDDARLTLALVQTAADHGAVVANHAPVVELRKDGENRVCGARIRPEDGPDGGIEVRARAVVSATGVWADEIRDLDERRRHVMRPAKGVHIVVPQTELPCDAAVILPSPSDNRNVFVIPWGDKTYVGTTDTDYEGSLRGRTVGRADVAYLLDAVNAVVTHPVTEDTVTGTWSGLRPLLAPAPGRRRPSERTVDLSRRHKVLMAPSGLVTITGGKLTTYRKMAADTVDVLVRQLGVGARRGWTEHLPVHGSTGLADLRQPGAAQRFGVAEATFAHLLGRYGDDTPAVLAVVGERPDFAEPVAGGLPFLAGEVIYAVRCEMAATVEDVLSRRMRVLPFDARAASAAAARVAQLMAGELGWDPERTATEVKRFRELAAASLPAVAASGDRAGEPR